MKKILSAMRKFLTMEQPRDLEPSVLAPGVIGLVGGESLEYGFGESVWRLQAEDVLMIVKADTEHEARAKAAKETGESVWLDGDQATAACVVRDGWLL